MIKEVDSRISQGNVRHLHPTIEIIVTCMGIAKFCLTAEPFGGNIGPGGGSTCLEAVTWAQRRGEGPVECYIMAGPTGRCN